jgi:hypothetical protein
MPNLYTDTIHSRQKELKEAVIEIANKNYASLTTNDLVGGQALGKEKESIIKELNELCDALFQKIEFLNFHLQTIKTFGWDFRGDLEKPMELHDGNLKIKFNHTDTVDYFIFFAVSGFLSTLSSIIDILAEILRYSFRVNLSGKLPTIKNVNQEISNEGLRVFIQARFCKNYSYYGMRHLRKCCEHKNHLNILRVRRVETEEFPGRIKQISIEARINTKLMEEDFPTELSQNSEGEEVDVYCEYLYKKIVEDIEGFYTELCKVRLTN